LLATPFIPIHKAYVEWLMQLWRSRRTCAELDRMNYAGPLSMFDAIAARDPDRASYSARATWNPTKELQVSWGHITSPELLVLMVDEGLAFIYPAVQRRRFMGDNAGVRRK
jgi:hypothetical protein